MTNRVARIENFFIENAQYVLNTREQKIILHLAANLDTNADNFLEQIIPVKTLEEMLKRSDKAKWGGIYKEMQGFTEKIVSKTIKFPTNILLNGKPLPGFISWFSSISPCLNDEEQARCEHEDPPFESIGNDHVSACHFNIARNVL